MPNGWTRIGTPQDMQQVIDDPDALSDLVEDKIEACGGKFLNLFQDRHDRRQYVFFEVPDHDSDRIFDCIDQELGSPAKRLNKLK